MRYVRSSSDRCIALGFWVRRREKTSGIIGEWSDNVRSALVWLGYVDPVATMNEAREHDQSRLARMAMLRAIFHAYGGERRTATQMIDDAKAGLIIPAGKSLLDGKDGR